ncbi:MAG: hypothetical protein SW833_20070 [Cyanobacteriota bacterium]|nr:hypothetical protein [Cyanobacteriota bacterium]
MITLRLEIRGNLDELLPKKQQADCDWLDVNTDINSLLGVACEMLEETGIFFFKMSGFGRENWPVEVYPDLACVLEQLSEAIDAIRQERYPFNLELYEQGIEKTITFNKKNNEDFIEAKCHDFFPQESSDSSSSWIPNPDTITIAREDILSQLLVLKSSFVKAVQKICPDLAAEDLFIAWCKG